VTKTDEAGVHAPYALGLAASLFNLLPGRYGQGHMAQMQHMKTVMTEGVVRLPVFDSGGLTAASGKMQASIALGRDLTAGFI